MGIICSVSKHHSIKAIVRRRKNKGLKGFSITNFKLFRDILWTLFAQSVNVTILR